MKHVPTLLVTGFYIESVRTLLPVVERLRSERPIRPVFVIGARGPLGEAGAAIVRAAGFDLYDAEPIEADLDGRVVYDPWQRTRLLRRANIDLANRILDQTRPEGILCAMDLARGEFVRTAARRGIPSVYVQWTEIHSPEFHRRFRRAELRWMDAQLPPRRRIRQRVARLIDRLAEPDWTWPLFTPATMLAVQGSFTRDMCVRAGIHPDKVRVTGSPQCDEMYECARFDAARLAQIRQSLGLDGETPFLLYPHEHAGRLRHLDPRSAVQADESLLRGLRMAMPNTPRVVKLHPKDEAGDRARVIAADPEAIIVSAEYPIGHLIAASSLVVSMTSSTLLWAVGIDRPAISAYFWKGVDEFRLTRHWSGVDLVETVEDLVAAIRANLLEPTYIERWRERRRACREEFLRVDGKAVSRIAGTYQELVDATAAVPPVRPSVDAAWPQPREVPRVTGG